MQKDKDDPEKKLDWMYKKPGQKVNHEEYLLGRSIDKEFEALAQEERIKNQVEQGIAPKNHVEHECVPFSIRSYRDAPQEQVDMARKLQEDPLVAIKKREMESRQQLLQNPVKLKELHRILKEEKMKKQIKKKKKKKSDDREKPKKSKTKKKSLGLEEEEKNLDDILAEKYAKLKAALDESLDMGSLLKSKKEQSKDSSSDDSSDETAKKSRKRSNDTKLGEKREYRERGSPDRNRSRNRNNDYVRCNNTQSYSNRYDDSRYGNKSYRNSDDEKSYSSKRINSNRREDYPKYRREDHRPDQSRHDKYSRNANRSERRDDRHDRGNRKDDRSERNDDKHDRNERNDDKNKSTDVDNEPEKSHYGLVTADGKKIELKGTTKIRERNVETKPVKKHYVSNKRPKLTEEEIEKRRKEMHENALWRDKELETNIKKYKEDDHKEDQKNNSEFDTDFLKKQLAKAADLGSLESRIKSNINNIQRSGRAMDMNFAKR